MIEAARRFHRTRPGFWVRFRRWINRDTAPRTAADVLLKYSRTGYADLRGYRHDRV